MSDYTSGGREVVYSDSDDEPNEAAFAGINPEFKKLVQTVKRQLYTSIIEGPPITSVDAQDNTLLIKYLKKSNRLYKMCERLHKLTPLKLEKTLSRFPLQTHNAIKQLLDWLRAFYSNNKEVDIIPYDDYLDVQLKRYPCLQKII